MWYEVRRSCPFTPFRSSGTIFSPRIAQMTPNFAQVCITTCQMISSPCHAKLVWNFQKFHEKTQIWPSHYEACTKNTFTFNKRASWWHATPPCDHRKPLGTFWKPMLYSKTLVNRSLTKSSEIHKKFKNAQKFMKPSPVACLCQFMSMKNNKLEEKKIPRQSSM